MSNLFERQSKIRLLLKMPSTVIIGSVALLLTSQLFASLCIALLPKGISSTEQSMLLVVVTGIVMASLLQLVLILAGGSVKNLGITSPKKGWIKHTAIAFVAYVLFSTLLITVVSLLIKNFNPNQVQDVGVSDIHSIYSKILGFITLVVLTPLIEETLFRGILFRGLSSSAPVWLAAGVSSALFALAHGQWNVALDTFVLGLLLCYVTTKTKSIVPGMVMHALKNSLAFVLLFVVK